MSSKKANLIKDGLQFIGDARKELRKVSWPARKETTAITVAVIISVFIMGFYLGFTDWILSEIVKYMIR